MGGVTALLDAVTEAVALTSGALDAVDVGPVLESALGMLVVQTDEGMPRQDDDIPAAVIEGREDVIPETEAWGVADAVVTPDISKAPWSSEPQELTAVAIPSNAAHRTLSI